jgi:hypothetical protein
MGAAPAVGRISPPLEKEVHQNKIRTYASRSGSLCMAEIAADLHFSLFFAASGSGKQGSSIA